MTLHTVTFRGGALQSQGVPIPWTLGCSRQGHQSRNKTYGNTTCTEQAEPFPPLGSSQQPPLLGLRSDLTSKPFESASKCPVFPTNALFFNFFMLKLEVTRQRNKDVDLRHDDLNDYHMGTFHARLQGAEGVTFGNEHTSTTTNGESTELCSSILVVSTLEGAFNLETLRNCLFLSGDIERRTECKKVQLRTFSPRSFAIQSTEGATGYPEPPFTRVCFTWRHLWLPL